MTFHTPQSQPNSPGVDQQVAKQPPAPPPRPPIPQRGSSLVAPPSPRPTPARPRPDPAMGESQGVYVNMSELAWMAASKAQEMAASLPPPPPELTAPPDREYSTSESSIESSSGYGSQTQPPEEPVYGIEEF